MSSTIWTILPCCSGFFHLVQSIGSLWQGIKMVCLVYQGKLKLQWNLTCHRYAWMNRAGNEQHRSFWIEWVITDVLTQASCQLLTGQWLQWLTVNYAKAPWTDSVCPILQTVVLITHFLLYSTSTRDEPPHNHTYQRIMGGAGKFDRYLEKHQFEMLSLRLRPRSAFTLRQRFVCLASFRIFALVLPTADVVLFCSARAWREGKWESREGYKSGSRVRMHAQ